MRESVEQTKAFEIVTALVRGRLGLSLAVVFLVGLVIGWVGLGWGLAPVSWEDAGPAQLHPDYQRQWVQMTSDSFILTTDLEMARKRLGWLGGQGYELVEQTRLMTQGADQLRIAQLQFAVGQVMSGAETSAAEAIANDSGHEDVLSEGMTVDGGNSPRAALPAIVGGLLAVVAMSVGGFFLVRRFGFRTGSRVEEPGPLVGGPENDFLGMEELVGPTGPAVDSVEQGDPVARFMTTYLLGDDLYDDSFSIDDANGDFLGECGMGMSDTVGVGEPKKACAFEIWLFDKNDVRTVTKVLMSEEAFGNDEKRINLAPKGEPMMASPGNTMVLETASLYVTARVVDMQYGSGALPQNSFFHQLTIELAAWKKT